MQLSAHLHGTPAVFPGSPRTSHGWRKTQPERVHEPANLHGFSPAPGIAVGSATGAARTGGGPEVTEGVAAVEAPAPFFWATETCDFEQSCSRLRRSLASQSRALVGRSKTAHGILARELLFAGFTEKNETALLGRNGRRVRVRARRLRAVDAVLADRLVGRLGGEDDGRGGRLRGAGLVELKRWALAVLLLLVPSRSAWCESWVECRVVRRSGGVEALRRSSSSLLLARPALHRGEGLSHGGGLRLREHLRVKAGRALREATALRVVLRLGKTEELSILSQSRKPDRLTRRLTLSKPPCCPKFWFGALPDCTRSKMLFPPSFPFRGASLRSPPPRPFVGAMFLGPAGTPSKPCGGRS